MNANPLQIYIITEGKAGHLSQAKGIASLVEGEKIIHTVNVNLQKGTLESLFRTSVALNHKTGKPSNDYLWEIAKKHINPSDIEHIEQNPPNLVISAGTIPSSINVILSKRYRCPNIVAMKPSVIPLDAFKLAILPLHDVPSNPPDNIIAISTSPNECCEELIKNDGEAFASENQIDKNERYWALFLGGESKARQFPSERVCETVKIILEEARSGHYKCLITTSRRTPSDFENLLHRLAENFSDQVAYLQIYSKNPKSTTKGILALSQTVFITEDSVSMVSESLWAHRKTFLIELPSQSKVKFINKIDRFKANLIEKKLISTISDDINNDTFSKSIKFEPNWESFTDIEMVKSAVNRLI